MDAGIVGFGRRDQHSIDFVKSLGLVCWIVLLALALNPGGEPLVNVTAA